MEVNPAGKTYNIVNTSAGQLGSLGKDEFLKILVAQLRNQDPTKPMDDTQFISQLAQFSALEQMQQLNTAFSFSRAYSLLGRSVAAQVNDENGKPLVVTGTVDGVTTIYGMPYLYINGDLVSMSAPITVLGSGNEELMLQCAAMIGKYVTGSYTGEDGVTTHTVSGFVERIALQDGSPVLYVDGHAVRLMDVTEVALKAPAQPAPPEQEPTEPSEPTELSEPPAPEEPGE